MDYETLRTFADTWGLVFLVVLFLGIVAFAFRRGAREHHRDASNVIFRYEFRPRKDRDRDDGGSDDGDGGNGD